MGPEVSGPLCPPPATAWPSYCWHRVHHRLLCYCFLALTECSTSSPATAAAWPTPNAPPPAFPAVCPALACGCQALTECFTPCLLCCVPYCPGLPLQGGPHRRSVTGVEGDSDDGGDGFEMVSGSPSGSTEALPPRVQRCLHALKVGEGGGGGSTAS